MRRSVCLPLIAALACFFFPPASFAEEAPHRPILKSIHVRPEEQGALIELTANAPFPFVLYTLADPPRLVVDFLDSSMTTTLASSAATNEKLVSSWQILGDLDYLSFALSSDVDHEVSSNQETVVIRVFPKGRKKEETFEKPLPEPPPAIEQGLTEPGAPTVATSFWTLPAALAYGLSKHRPMQISQEELTLARLRLREAHRALYPAATLKSSWTAGVSSDTDFREFSSGLQLDYPLYSSGRLTETYRQALVNIQVAEKRYSKTRSDFSLEIAQAYFQLVSAQETLALQKESADKALRLLDQTRLRFSKGFLTRVELLNVEAQANQAQLQRVTAENDLLLSRLKFLYRLGLEPGALAEVPFQLSKALMEKIDLEEAMHMALQYRPDIQLNSLLVQFHEMEERIAKAKGKLKVELSGFIGASGAAFETEPIDAGEDYFVGLRASQAWGPHGANISATTTKTSPRLGQTTRTDSTVLSGELGLLNQFQGFSEIQQSLVGLAKARHDLEEVKQTVFQEVQEAYVSYTKARLQVEYAGQKMGFRQEQLKILEMQAALGEAPPSQVIETMMRLTDEKVAQVQGLSNAHVALAKLGKAVGIPGRYQERS